MTLPHSVFFAGMLTLLSSAPTQAVVLDIDFRAPEWAAAHGQSSPFVLGDVTLQAAYFVWPDVGTFFHDLQDGIGIDNDLLEPDVPDELDLFELLTVTFANGYGNGLTGVLITDLFDESIPVLAPEAEKGLYRINEGAWVPFYGALSDPANGEQLVSFGGATDVTRIDFSVGYDDYQFGSDFSVGGFARQQVPGSPPPAAVPDGGASLGLLGVALFGLGGVGRHLRKVGRAV